MLNTTNGDTIAIDAMGSDRGPSEIVESVYLSMHNPEAAGNVILVGDTAILEPLLAAKGLLKDPRVGLFHASQVITMDDKPLQSLKQKKDASMVRAIELVKEKKADAVLSCGNTGSLMACGTIKLRTLPGFERPALATIIPNTKTPSILIDAGANPEPEVKHLVNNAILGSLYAQAILNIENPKVGLLTIGTEEGKGNQLINAAHEILKQCQGAIHYTGLAEGFAIFEDTVDVIVCDGFVGNIVIKAAESLINMLKDFIKEEMHSSVKHKIAGYLCKDIAVTAKKTLDPEQFGGAPLLGLNGLVMKAHGSSNRYAFMHAIRIGRKFLKFNINDKAVEIAKQLESKLTVSA